jgi:hypothetical protein
MLAHETVADPDELIVLVRDCYGTPGAVLRDEAEGLAPGWWSVPAPLSFLFFIVLRAPYTARGPTGFRGCARHFNSSTTVIVIHRESPSTCSAARRRRAASSGDPSCAITTSTSPSSAFDFTDLTFVAVPIVTARAPCLRKSFA